MSERTTKERLVRIEILLEEHIKHHNTRDKWMMRIVAGLVVGVILLTLPGCLEVILP
ncbi:hypothetical protein LCGC14_0737260 [marine sediment metagenome]|uniref:Uncharacterized protein n=1 Tax=marine sediment metagenome TaxID=412755 RepID=A0A0F9TEZ6_9ZZZZ